MLLKGFAFSGYRSFGENLTKLPTFRKINLIIGQNNVGKSNIINFLQFQYGDFVEQVNVSTKNKYSQRKISFKKTDFHISRSNAKQKIGFPILSHELDDYIFQKLKDKEDFELAKKVLCSVPFLQDNIVWFIYQSDNLNSPFSIEVDYEALISTLKPVEWNKLWYSLTKKTGGGLEKHWIPETISRLAYVPSSVPKVQVIPAIRKIGAAGTSSSDFSGEGIIERLAMIQNPSLSEQKDKEKFISINEFLQKVLENDSAKIEIPYERDMILVHMDGKTLPLDSLGTGVHEVVILAAAATLLEETVICIEEPELHLHPLLQRKLVKYLDEETDNQYFFTTHSAHLLDAVEAGIFHVTQVNGSSFVHSISSTQQKSDICKDLGYKASDILQANCIIWVEGPSDRIYLNYWLEAKNKNFVEGIHYSIMFYGGKLFSHFTALDNDEIQENINDFISLKNLNRNAVIIFDSDKQNPRARLNETKRRLKKEFDDGAGFAWVTKGREIENYLDYDKVEKSVLSVHSLSASELLNKGQYENLLKYKNKKKEVTASKVKVAKNYIKNNPADLGVLDLKQQIEKLCKFISQVNNHDV